jgi:starvation-inducible DNA-binding protein
MEELIAQLRTLQASTFIYYTKAHGYHWNVEGILFDQFHEMFSDIYTDAFDAVDTLAEWQRSFAQFAEFQVGKIAAVSNVTYDLDLNANNPIQMLQSLLKSNEQLITDYKVAFNTATSTGEQGVANFFADRITAHEKFRWKITASLKSMVVA